MFLILAALGIAALAHLAPFPFLLDVTDRTIWRMPKGRPPTVYLTFDDGPNPTATPQLLDVLARHGVSATFFIIDKHLTRETAPIVRRAFEEGHAVALHSHTRTIWFRDYQPAPRPATSSSSTTATMWIRRPTASTPSKRSIA